MEQLKKTAFVLMVAVEFILRHSVKRLTMWHERVITGMLNAILYKDGPGEVSVGMIEDMRVVGYVYIRDHDRQLRRLPFNVQNLPRSDLWSVNYTRKLTTELIRDGYNVVWIEHDRLVASPADGRWIPMGANHAKILNMARD